MLPKNPTFIKCAASKELNSIQRENFNVIDTFATGVSINFIKLGIAYTKMPLS